ncbi:MAG TPA: AAA family ATPase [Candidatus Polarisedimenticolia bacterium]|nr:AAA family ATPase [Candidatus Polarisedimenticolia bacterium]
MALARPRIAQQRSPVLIERDEPLATLRRSLEDEATAIGRIILIRGEAGIGKTALLKAFVKDCPSDVDVLWGACDGVSTPQPYGPFEDMADALGAEFRHLLDGNASRGDIGRWLLKWMAAGPIRVLVIEDVQWADQATLDLLAFLARRIESLPVLLLVTHRDGEGRAPSVDRILGGVASLPVLRQLPLEPLSRAGVERLAGDPGIDAGALHRITAGNPFYVHEVLDAGLSRIPMSVRDAVRARVAQLDERGRRALQVAAVLGVRSEPWLLAAVAGEDILGIDDCLRIGLLTKVDGIAFGHELTRMVVLEDMPVIHGIALHRRALAALEQAGVGDPARLAYHAEGAAERDAVLRHAAAAGHRALAAGSHREAIAQFERALRFADGLTADARAALVEPLSQALYLINHLPEAYRAAAEAAALRRRGGDDLATSAALSFLAEVAWRADHGPEAWTAARDAIALAEPMGDGGELAMAYAALGRLEMLNSRNEEGRASSERALEIARRIEDAEVTAVALGTIGSIELDLGDERGWADLGESVRIGRELHRAGLVDRALYNLGFMAFVWRRYELAREYFQQVQDYFQVLWESSSRIDLYGIDSPIAEIECALGNWDAAVERGHAALTGPRRRSADRLSAMTVLARIAVRRGEPGSEAQLAELRGFVRSLESVAVPLEQMVLVAEAEAAWISGDLGPFLPRLRAAYDAACRAGSRAAIGELGIWLWRGGALSELDARAEEAYLLEVAGRAREAAAVWAELSVPYEAALSLAGSSDPADAQRAHAELTRLGATAVAHKVALRLRDLGGRVPRGPRPTTRANPRGLTDREWEIAHLLALGLSNAEIADRLVVSPKTVGHHVSAVLAKLAVRRRAEVAAAISEIGGGGA